MSRLVKTFITSLIIILLGGIAVLALLLYGEEKAATGKTIDDMVEHSYETPEITTDLSDGSYVRIQFQVITDDKTAMEEISKRDFQLKNILIKELAVMNEENFRTGLSDLEGAVKSKLNELMTDGKVTDVYTISKLLQ
ncbi:flagellar basal body-associated protein FliL [Virgibacillus sp. YIM 98842]|uniref:flagellar basal body-associated protein FliL n=1 Tax=Virgibacillus sp. YIM 98842 TaxID=2663533 RepID=UPI0013DB47DD|nr:flagellar basal body-associated protein FliL [Virgibacillus sp. YIM 98842]